MGEVLNVFSDVKRSYLTCLEMADMMSKTCCKMAAKA